MTGQIRAIPTRTNSRAARIARLIQRAAIRSQLSTPEGRRLLYSIANELDLDGAMTLVEELSALSDEEDRQVILRELSRRPEEELRRAALRELAA